MSIGGSEIVLLVVLVLAIIGLVAFIGWLTKKAK